MQTKLPVKTRADHHELVDIRAIDGDTIQARIILGFTVSIIRRIRLRGFYAPEHHGANPGTAQHATERLQGALERGEITISQNGLKEDVHGRITAYIFRDGVALNPHEVLGCFQLSEKEHAADLRTAKLNQGRKVPAL